MGNCCRSPAAVAREDVKAHFHDRKEGGGGMGGKKPNGGAGGRRMTVLTDVSWDARSGGIEEKYVVDKELGRESSE
ncbi:hypothetical protein HPP92_019782 [Vanilla planifolia]|uniref:Uncharacterized protein n=1 Tax=Vanilla planifolia TaxID=51239 RepID=A0A835Q751_VANPL|nr:hypothetical protein HPP92_019782 [Vanilla planifolia]